MRISLGAEAIETPFIEFIFSIRKLCGDGGCIRHQSELGIETIGARLGHGWSGNRRVLFVELAGCRILGRRQADIGEAPMKGMSNRGRTLIRRLRVCRRSGGAWGLELTTMNGRGGYLGDVTADLVLGSLASAALPPIAAEVGGIVQIRRADMNLEAYPLDQRDMSWGWGAPQVAFSLEIAYRCLQVNIN